VENSSRLLLEVDYWQMLLHYGRKYNISLNSQSDFRVSCCMELYAVVLDVKGFIYNYHALSAYIDNLSSEFGFILQLL